MNEPAKPRLRAVTGRWLLGSLTLGAGIGVAANALFPDTFSGWFIPAAAVATLFLLGAHFRRARWEERNACIFIAGAVVVVPLFDHWVVVAGIVAGLVGYWLLLAVLAYQREEGPGT